MNVRYALQGGVERDNTRIRVYGALIDTQSGAQLWSEVFDGDQSDIFSLQDQITVRIANSISRHLVVVAARETQKKVTSPTVTDLLMRGIAIAETTQTKPNLIQQAEFFHKAALLDPSNVEAHARLARAMALLPWQFGTLLTKEEFNADIKEASDEADKAIAIDPDYALSYVGKGLALLALGDPVSAKRFFKKGHSLDPNNIYLLYNLGSTSIYRRIRRCHFIF